MSMKNHALLLALMFVLTLQAQEGTQEKDIVLPIEAIEKAVHEPEHELMYMSKEAQEAFKILHGAVDHTPYELPLPLKALFETIKQDNPIVEHAIAYEGTQQAHQLLEQYH